MSLGAVLVSFLEVLLTVAFIILIAFCIRWAAQVFIGGLDAKVEYWGRVVVGLLCLIVVVSWLLSLFGLVTYPFPTFRPVTLR
jgi:hypothetical protein